uniref:aromatase n=1 Tax=Oncorhynchus mykiss TaxID=8022 RepID=A0A8K9Y1N4_ONCMY
MAVIDAVLDRLLDGLLGLGRLLSPLCSPFVLLQLSALVVLLLLSLRVVCLLWSHAQFTRRLRCFSKPPTQNWLMGHLGEMRSTEEGLQAVDQLVRTYSHSCSWFLGPFYSLVRLFHPDYIKPLLLAPGTYIFHSWVLAHFHFPLLNVSKRFFYLCALMNSSKWRRLVAEGESRQDMFNHISLMTLDSLLRCTFSYNSNCQESSSEYIAAIFELSTLVIERRGRILHHWDCLYWRSPEGQRFKQACSVVHGFTRTVVQERRAQLLHRGEPEGPDTTGGEEKKKKRVADFIDLLLLSKDEDGHGLTDEEIKAEADTFMFGGHDTTASGISWVLYNLSQHQDYQDRCRAEVNDLLQDRKTEDLDWSAPVCLSVRQSVCLLACLSLFLSGGWVIPQGSICLVSIYGNHHNPEIWPDPDVYNPMRFDPENSKDRSSHAFIPFSSGPRNCIGQKFAMAELRVVVALTLRRFRLTPGGVEVRRLPQLVLRAEGGLWLTLETLDAPQD